MEVGIDPNSLPPAGLLGLFQIKSAGSTPRPMNGLQFTFEASDFYLRAIEQVRNVTNTFSVLGGVGLSAAGLATVPQGKMWLITALKASAVAGAAELARFKLALIPISGQVLVFGSSATTSLTDAAAAGAAAVGLDRPMLIGPGYQMGIYVERVTTAASITINTDFRFIEFPI